MNYKLIWKLSTGIDKIAHLSTCFMLLTVANRFTGLNLNAVVVCVVLGSVLLEYYQHAFKPNYPTKLADTFLDLIADGIGIGLACVVIRGWV